jgi:hypothetical protein
LKKGGKSKKGVKKTVKKRLRININKIKQDARNKPNERSY